MVSKEVLENAVRTLLKGRLSGTVIWQKGSTASGASVSRPQVPYTLLDLVSDVAEGLPDGYGEARQHIEIVEGRTITSYLEKLVEDRYVRVSIRAYGDSSWDLLSDLRLWLQTDAAQTLATASSLGIVSLSDITDLTALDGAGWEQVAQMDLRVHHREFLEVDSGYIETVRIAATHQRQAVTMTTDTITAEV